MQQCHTVNLKAMQLENKLTPMQIQIAKYNAFANATVSYGQFKTYVCTWKTSWLTYKFR